MKHVFYQINQIKKVFKDICQTNIMIWASKLDHFNFPKWYVISHYLKQIKYYKSGTSFTINIEEVIHIMQIKDFFKRIKIKKGYEKQILNHNAEKFSQMIRDNIDIFSSNKKFTEVEKNAAL